MLHSYWFTEGGKVFEAIVREEPTCVMAYWGLAVNAVTLAPGKVVMNAGSPTVAKRLEALGVEVIQIDFSESHNFAIAGLHCATLELQRDQ